MIDACQRLLLSKVPSGIFRHSVEVMHCLQPVSRIYGFNLQTASRAALLHDLASHYSDDELIEKILLYEPNFLDDLPFEQWDHTHLHGPVGAWTAMCELGVEDMDVIRAIREHSGTFSQMSDLGRCLYVADNLAPSSHGGLALDEHLARLFYEGNVMDAMAYIARIGPHRSSSIPPPIVGSDRATIPPPAD